jgi:hypothetical protein
MIDPVSVAVGAGMVVVILVLGLVFKKLFKKKPRVDLYNLRKKVYESGIKTKEVYENLLELEKMFKQIEGNK